jgi:very-short-patch-repair endonuclease
MKIKTTDGEEIILRLDKYLKKGNIKSRSKQQENIKEELLKQYPHDRIYEEVYVPKDNIYLDFFIPSVKIVVEVQGIQHKKHVKFFHKTINDFHRQLDRDDKKRRWCKINNFKLVEIYV